MHKPIPLAVETATTSARGLGHPVIVVKVLGDGNFAWKFRVNLIVAPLQQTPSFWNIHAKLIGAAHVFGAVPAQTIHAEFIQPHHGIVANVLAHFGARIIHTRIAPRCFGARGVVVKINAAQIVLAPTIKLPHVQVIWTKMVEDHIVQYRDSARVAFIHKSFQVIGSSV